MAWRDGAFTSENRRGRTSHEHPPLLFAGTAGFGEWSGSVWGVHVAWSGNHALLAERLPDGRRVIQAGELLHPGEVALEPGESYRTPTVIAVHSDHGLTAASQQYPRPTAGAPEPSRRCPARCWSTRGRRSTSITTWPR